MGRQAIETDLIGDISPTAYRAARGSALHRAVRGSDDNDRWEPWEGMNANIGHPVDDRGNINWEGHATLDNLEVDMRDLVVLSRNCANRITRYAKYFGWGRLDWKLRVLTEYHKAHKRGEDLAVPRLLKWAEVISCALEPYACRPYPQDANQHEMNTRKKADIGLAYADLHVLMFLLDRFIPDCDRV